ncbi:MAG: hypothetical protein LBG08_01130 [Spirochaetaceae bacterium]|jgi:uncharacterized membrane protein YbhN (UPF0104 family)|nr:hypothetical protein [Spirochaetaceae bacterium]
MKNPWKFFWRFFGLAVLVMFVLAVVLGLVKHSVETIYIIVQQTIAVAFGICGFIGFVIVPIDLYLEERKQERMNRVIE